jgi:type II secretion system protein N
MTDYPHSDLSTADISGDGSDTVAAPAPEPVSRGKSVARVIGWTSFGLACLVTFTVLKLPEDRIKNYAQGMIASQLAAKGIGFSAERGYLSVGLGISYVMKDVTLSPPPPASPVKIDKISFTPAILPLVMGYQGGTLWIYEGDGTLTATVSMKGTQASGSFKAKQIDLGKTGVLALAAGIMGTVPATGHGTFSGDLNVPSTLTADIDLTLGKTTLEATNIQGFAVPRIKITEGKVELSADKGKATLKTVKLGKAGSPDDVIATVTGDVMLGRNWDTSTMNLKVNFKPSENLIKPFVFIDALLGAGKQGDGSYNCSLTGTMNSPQFVPVGAGG